MTTTSLEMAHFSRGDYERVVELATGNLRVLPADRVHEYFGGLPASIQDRFFLASSLAELGRFAEAAAAGAEALRLAEPTQHGFTIGTACLTAARPRHIRGDWEEARALYERLIAALRAENVIMILPFGVSGYALTLAQLGEVSAAQDQIRDGEQLLERRAATGMSTRVGLGFHSLASASLAIDRVDEARRFAHRMVEFVPGNPGHAAYAPQMLGDIAAHPDRFDGEGAETHYREALALAEPLGMRPLVARCHLGLGKVYGRTGKPADAHEHLTIATTMCREMGMRFWLTEGEAELRKIGA